MAEGTTVTLTVAAAGGTARLDYQWRKGGVALSGATAASLVLSNVAMADSGSYDVVVSNHLGSVTSATATLTVRGVPVIGGLSAARQTVAPGHALTLQVDATGTGGLSYQWYHNGRVVTGGTASTLTTAAAAVADAGVYWVNVTDDIGTRRSAAIHVLLTPATSEVLTWGLNDLGQRTVPTGLDTTVAVAAGSTHVLALRADGTVVAWGDHTDGACDVPDGLANVVALAAGDHSSFALKADGTVTAWGQNTFGQTTVPTGLSDVVGLAAGEVHVLAVRIDGSVVGWGYGGSGVTTPPSGLGPVVSVAATKYSSFALQADGTIVAWGYNGNGELNVPAELTTAVTVRAGGYHGLALKADGTVAGWGFSPPATPPTGLTHVVALAAGELHSLALTDAGTVQAWGQSSGTGSTTVPAGLDAVIGIAAGSNFSVAVRQTIVPVAPSISSQPTSQTVNAGQSVTFAVVASGVPDPTFQWRKNSVAISGATAASYTMATVTAGDAASYDVVVTNSAGSVTSSAATLTVQTAPAISTQPTGQTVLAGGNVSFTVVATGNPGPTYQWRRNGDAISGATSATLDLTAVDLAAAGTYDVVVTNVVGSVTSNAVALVVQQAPAIGTQPESQTVNAGADVSFTVVASGTPAPTYQWRLGGTNIPDATAATLTLTAVTAASVGDYDVVVTNPVGTVTSSVAALTVQTAPTIATQPTGQTVVAGGNVSFTVVATGNPGPTYQWRRNGDAISGATSATLDLTGVTLADAGDYDVVVTNVVGSATSDAASLVVQQVPVITIQPAATATAMDGGSVTLSVTATGTPAPTYQWFHDGEPVTGATAATLALSPIGLSDAGSYVVTVTNGAGAVTSSVVSVTVVQLTATHSGGAGYRAGQTATISNTVTYAGPVDQLDWSVLPPTATGDVKWRYASGTGSLGTVVPAADQVDLWEWSWTTLPTSPFSFTYTVNVPADVTGAQSLTAMVQLTANGVPFQGLVVPEPLVLSEAATAHTADTNADLKIDLSELLRVIQLYNTRNGTTRTGRYLEQTGTVDGFGAAPTAVASDPVTLTRFHAADTDHDASLSLSELLRVIQLYNYRAGTTRTGEYHVQPDTVDGFAPGPAS